MATKRRGWWVLIIILTLIVSQLPFRQNFSETAATTQAPASLFAVLRVYAQGTTTNNNTTTPPTPLPANIPTTAAGFIPWFANLHGSSAVNITIDNPGTATTPPPYISLPADSSSGRPALKFVFGNGNLASQEGQVFKGVTAVSSAKWIAFQGNVVNGDGSLTPIPGLYYVTSDGSGSGNGCAANMDYAPNASNIQDIVANICSQGYSLSSNKAIGGGLLGGSNGGDLGIAVPDDPDVNNVFDYIMNVPKGGGNDCSAAGGVYTTAPSGGDGLTVKAIATANNLDDTARLLSTNCVNTSSTGWMAKWGVTNTNVVGGGACGLNTLLGGGTADVGTIFSNLMSCIFNSIFAPIVAWVAGLVSSASGLSYLDPPNVLAARFSECVG